MPEFGPYEQPGWPSSLPYFKPGETFRNAFAIGSEINRRKQQLENQMMAMSLRNQQNEINNQIKIAEYQRKLEQGDQRLELMQQGVNLRDTMFQWKADKDKETMGDISTLAQGLGAITLAPDDPKRPNAIYDVIQRNARGAKAAPFLIKDAFGNFNNAARGTQNKFSSDYNDFIKDVKNTAGLGQLTNLGPLYNTEQWNDQWKSRSTGVNVGPPVTEEQKKDYYKTGNKWMTIPSSDPNKPATYVTLPSAKLTQLNRRLQDLDSRKSTLPSQVSNEFVTPQIGTGNGASGTITVKTSDGAKWKIPATSLDAVKQRDPNVVVIP